MNTKNLILILSLLFIGMTVHSSFMEPVSAASVNVTSNMTNSQIQSILDNADSGDTVNFLGKIYKNLQLTINKALNIVTSVGTKIISSNPSNPVFLINGSKASGTNISGFNITGSGILINNTRNVTISNNNISSAKGSAITVNKSSDTTIKNNKITNSGTGINISSSKNTTIKGNTVKNNQEDGITITNSANTSINKNKITENYGNGVGIYDSKNSNINGTVLHHNGKNINGSAVYISNSNSVNVTHSIIQNNSNGISIINGVNVIISNNSIVDNDYDGILTFGLTKNVTIAYNNIERNYNGINLNSNSKKGNIHITANLITNNGHGNEGNGIYLGENYAQSKTDYIGHNAIFGNIGWDVNGHDTPGNVHFGSNWFGASPKRCCAMFYDPDIYLVLIRTGSNTYQVAFLDGVTNGLVTDLWSIPVTASSGSFLGTFMTQNGVAAFMIPAGEGGDTIIATANGASASLDWRALIQTGYPYPSGDDPEPGDPGNGSGGNGNDPNGGGEGNNAGPSTVGSGGGSGGNPGSGASSGASSSVGHIEATAAASAAGSAGNTGSAGSSGQDTKTAQELFIDDPAKNPQIWGIIGIIVLLIIIFGAYYRKDLMKMVKKSRK